MHDPDHRADGQEGISMTDSMSTWQTWFKKITNFLIFECMYVYVWRGGVISSVDVWVGGPGGGEGRMPCFTVIIFYNIEGPNSSIYSSKGFRY